MAAKKPSQSKVSKKFWYVQDWGTYPNQTLVFIGYTEPEALVVMKKEKMNKETTAHFEKDIFTDVNFVASVAGFVWHDTETAATLLFLPKFEDDWHSYEVLMHEVVHLVLNGLVKDRRFVDFVGSRHHLEQEGIAYQVEYLFRSIRRRLQQEYLGPVHKTVHAEGKRYTASKRG